MVVRHSETVYRLINTRSRHMRKQYKKARYKRAAARKTDRTYPKIKVFRIKIKELRKAADECGRSIAKALNKILEQ